MANRLKKLELCLFAGLAFLLPCVIQSASAQETNNKRIANANALVSSATLLESKPAARSAKGPYYVDFRARTAASWGHAFVWYGKTSERAVEVAGLTPAGDTLSYMLGYVTWVPSETGGKLWRS